MGVVFVSEEISEKELNQIALAITEEIEEIKEEELTEEEKVALKYIKKKIKDLEEFAQFAKVVHFYHKYYGLGAIDTHLTQEMKDIFRVDKDSFAFVDKLMITALTFNVKERTETIACRISLEHIKPLSRFLDRLLLNFHFPINDIRKVLSKYVSSENIDKCLLEIKSKLEHPVSISLENSDDIVMIISPRVIE
jgi:DNA-binding transcriptional MerR regulator